MSNSVARPTPRASILTETVFDELNRPIEVRRQLGEGFVITRTKYDGEGNRILELDPLDRVTVFDYDELNRRRVGRLEVVSHLNG